MSDKPLCFAPRDVFATILEYAVIPTFDLIVWCGDHRGVILLRRKIAPYKGVWALPGLRMMKPEDIDDTLSRVALQEKELGRHLQTLIRQYKLDPWSCQPIHRCEPSSCSKRPVSLPKSGSC